MCNEFVSFCIDRDQTSYYGLPLSSHSRDENCEPSMAYQTRRDHLSSLLMDMHANALRLRFKRSPC